MEENFEATDLPAGWAQQPDGQLDITVALAQELSQRNLTVEERAQFVKAKVDELRSFFENGVWTYAEPGTNDEQRTIKARFLLKWAKTADGMPCLLYTSPSPRD